jgi:hypothetical protein
LGRHSGRRTDLHRRVGWGLAVLAVVIVATSAVATFGIVPAMLASGLPRETVMALGPLIFWGNFATVVAFPVLLAAAIALRHNGAWHKRLMLLASIGMLALARIFQWPVFSDPLNANFVSIARVAALALIALPAAYDLATRGACIRPRYSAVQSSSPQSCSRCW